MNEPHDLDWPVILASALLYIAFVIGAMATILSRGRSDD